MRVLFLSPRQAWPTNSGAKLREFHLARCLAQQAEITLLAFAAEPDLLRESLPFCREVIAVPPPQRYTPVKLLRGLAGPHPLTVLNYSTAPMRDALSTLLERTPFDAVQIEGTPMEAYAPILLRRARPPVLIYDWHNIESELMLRYAEQSSSAVRRFYANRTAHLLAQTERRMLARPAAAHLVCSGREQTLLQSLAPRASVHLVPNGVDTQAFASLTPAAQRNRLLFVGTMDYHANIDAAVAFARDVWPQLHAALPNLRFTLAGANPAPAVRELASQPGIEVTGTVPSLLPYYAEAVASLVPLKTGGGTRLKILESFAAGVPVVSTAVGAEGLDAIPDQHFLLAESPADWTAAVHRIVSQPGVAAGMAQRAQAFARESYDWSVVGQKLCRIYASLVPGAL
ncbi:MAG: glycosyltransferase family 4 protein [Acidobacteriota bacterium]